MCVFSSGMREGEWNRKKKCLSEREREREREREFGCSCFSQRILVLIIPNLGQIWDCCFDRYLLAHYSLQSNDENTLFVSETKT